MPTVAQNIAAIRRRLGQPEADKPNDGVILQCLIDQLAHHSASLANTNNHWAVGHFTLTAVSDQEDYIITAANFGRPFLVYTVDTDETYHVRREIPISLLQNSDRLYYGPQQSYSSDVHSAAEICFYREDGGWKARFIPVPAATGDYEVWYETSFQYTAPSQTIGLESFHHLVCVQAAISALPHTGWRGCTLEDNPAAWQAKAAAVRDSLLHDEAMFQKQFNEYRAQASREGVTNKLPYGWESEGGGFYGGTMANGFGW